LPAVSSRPPSSEAPIEVEVLEIDGQAPRPPAATHQPEPGLRAWEAAGDAVEETPGGSGSPFIWQMPNLTRRSIHPLWWPFIVVAGAVLLALALTIGLAAFIGFVILRAIVRILRAVLS